MAAAIAGPLSIARTSIHTLSSGHSVKSGNKSVICSFLKHCSPPLHACTKSTFDGRRVIQVPRLRPANQDTGTRAPSASLGNFFNKSNEKYEASAPPYYEDADDAETEKRRQQVAKRLLRAAIEFRRWGNWGFWVQLVTAVVSAVILAFSVAITGQSTNTISAYLTAGGIVAAFVSVFNSFRYTRLAKTFDDCVDDPDNAPRRTDVVRRLRNGIVLNMVGLAATLLGAQATVGLLVAKALTSQSQPYLANTPQGFSPVLALDVFLVQASFNVVTAHFFGLLFQLLLLRSATSSAPPPESVLPKPA